MIWYVAYGTGLRALSEAEQRRVTIPYDSYTAGYHARDESGLPFAVGAVDLLDLGRPGETTGRAHLLTDEDFALLDEQQGPWYDVVADLGAIDGVPARCFTCSVRLPEDRPARGHQERVAQGEAEAAALPEATLVPPAGAPVARVRGELSPEALLTLGEFLAATAPGPPIDDGSGAPDHAPPGYHPRSLVFEQPGWGPEDGGFEYAALPALFGDRPGHGPLRVAWDTNVLSDYATFGAAMWEAEPFDPPVSEPRYRAELLALADLMVLWTVRDIRLHVFEFQLVDAKRSMPPGDAEVRYHQVAELASALYCTGLHSGAPDAAGYVPPRIDALPDTPDRRVLELAVDAGCHVLLTRDRPFLRRARAEAAARGVVVMEPTSLLAALRAAGEADLAGSGLPDNHKLAHVLPATAGGYHDRADQEEHRRTELAERRRATLREGYAPFGEWRTWYGVAGDLAAEKAPVVVLHGGPGATHDYLLSTVDLARQGRAVVLYDQLGNGRSTHLPDRGADFWTVELFVAELANLLGHLGIADRYHVVGQSWGGFLAQEHALTRPAGLRGLVLADTAASFPAFVEEANRLRSELPPEVEATLRRHEAAGTTDDPGYAEACQVFYDRHVCRIVPNPPEVAYSFAQIEADPTVYHTMNGPSEFHVVGSIKDWQSLDRLSLIRYPTLVVSGRYDEATPEVVRPLHEGIAGSEWVLFEHSSHLPHVEETGRWMTVVGEFLDRCD